MIGVFALPYFVIAETLGPLVEAGGYAVLPLAIVLGVLRPEFFPLFLVLTVGFGVLFSWSGILAAVVTFRRSTGVKPTLRLMGYGVLENVGYRQWKALVAWHALYEYVAGITDWGTMERSGFRSDPEHARAVDATAPMESDRAGGSGEPEKPER